MKGPLEKYPSFYVSLFSGWTLKFDVSLFSEWTLKFEVQISSMGRLQNFMMHGSRTAIAI